VDIVLGVSMAPRTVRLVAIEGQNADGVTVEQEEFAVGAAGNSAAGAVDQVIDAIIGSREGVLEGGHRLTSTGVTWSDPAGVGALRDAIATYELGGVMLVAPLLAAAALAQTVGYALGYERLAMLFVEPANATLAVVEIADGSIVDLHRRQTGDARAGGLAAELATMVSGLDARGSRADGVFLIGCGTDIVPLKSTLDVATSLPVTGPEEPDMALARGAALASANAPLFASSTAALAYALDPGTGELNPPAISPTYLDAWDNADFGTDARAYSAVPDEDDKPPRRPWSVLLAGSALAAIVAAIGGVVLVTLASDRPGSDVHHNSGVSVATPGVQLPAPPPQAPPPSNPPQAQLPGPSPAPAPGPSEVAAPAPAPSPVQQPAPQTPVAPPPAAPVYRAPTRQAPQYVPPPVRRAPPPVQEAAPPPVAAPAPPPAAPAPAPPPAAPQVPRQPPMTMYLHFPFVTVPIPINPPPPPGQ
jgi:hypothetical protein